MLLKKKPGDTPETLLNKLHRTSIIMVIMSELPALFGLFLFLLQLVLTDFYVSLIISVAILFIFFPYARFGRMANQPDLKEIKKVLAPT